LEEPKPFQFWHFGGAVANHISFSGVLRSIKKPIKELLPEKLIFQHSLRKELKNGEPELRILRCICNRSDICIDVGANHGIYSCLMSRYSQQVIAVEPHPRLAEQLKRVLPARVKVMNVAVSDEDGQSEFYIPTLNGEEIDSRASLNSTVNSGMSLRTVVVRKQRLDRLSIGSGRVGVIKVDVEGHELKALAGMSDILERHSPTIIVESEARHNPDAPGNVFAFLSQFGYRGYFVHRSRLRLLSDFSVEGFQNEASAKPVLGPRSPDYVNNFLFIHPTRREALDRVRVIFPICGDSLPGAALGSGIKPDTPN